MASQHSHPAGRLRKVIKQDSTYRETENDNDEMSILDPPTIPEAAKTTMKQISKNNKTPLSIKSQLKTTPSSVKSQLKTTATESKANNKSASNKSASNKAASKSQVKARIDDAIENEIKPVNKKASTLRKGEARPKQMNKTVSRSKDVKESTNHDQSAGSGYNRVTRSSDKNVYDDDDDSRSDAHVSKQNIVDYEFESEVPLVEEATTNPSPRFIQKTNTVVRGGTEASKKLVKQFPEPSGTNEDAMTSLITKTSIINERPNRMDKVETPPTQASAKLSKEIQRAPEGGKTAFKTNSPNKYTERDTQISRSNQVRTIMIPPKKTSIRVVPDSQDQSNNMEMNFPRRVPSNIEIHLHENASNDTPAHDIAHQFEQPHKCTEMAIMVSNSSTTVAFPLHNNSETTTDQSLVTIDRSHTPQSIVPDSYGETTNDRHRLDLNNNQFTENATSLSIHLPGKSTILQGPGCPLISNAQDEGVKQKMTSNHYFISEPNQAPNEQDRDQAALDTSSHLVRLEPNPTESKYEKATPTTSGKSETTNAAMSGNYGCTTQSSSSHVDSLRKQIVQGSSQIENARATVSDSTGDIPVVSKDTAVANDFTKSSITTIEPREVNILDHKPFISNQVQEKEPQHQSRNQHGNLTIDPTTKIVNQSYATTPSINKRIQTEPKELAYIHSFAPKSIQKTMPSAIKQQMSQPRSEHPLTRLEQPFHIDTEQETPINREFDHQKGFKLLTIGKVCDEGNKENVRPSILKKKGHLLGIVNSSGKKRVRVSSQAEEYTASNHTLIMHPLEESRRYQYLDGQGNKRRKINEESPKYSSIRNRQDKSSTNGQRYNSKPVPSSDGIRQDGSTEEHSGLGNSLFSFNNDDGSSNTSQSGDSEGLKSVEDDCVDEVPFDWEKHHISLYNCIHDIAISQITELVDREKQVSAFCDEYKTKGLELIKNVEQRHLTQKEKTKQAVVKGTCNINNELDKADNLVVNMTKRQPYYTEMNMECKGLLEIDSILASLGVMV